MDDHPNESLPKGLAAYENQVAGHDYKHGTSPISILKTDDGSILKPLVKEPQSTCEVNFYQRIFSNDPSNETQTLYRLKEFIPEFRGTVILKINNKDLKFLKLEDITKGSLKPCVMDLKIGARTWAPDATERKRKVEDTKYAISKQAYGFCIPGYKVYDISKRKFITFEKEEGKLLTKETLPQAFREFFNYDFGQMGILIDNYLPTIQRILSWWENQKIIHIYSSSLLFFYDAHYLEILKKNNEKELPVNWIKVCMIDFAHVVPADSLDLNYIDGLKRLLELLEQLRLGKK